MMKKFNSSFSFQPTLLALAVCAVCLPVQAQEKYEEGTVSVGIGAVNGSAADRAQFGQYNGLRAENGAVGMLGFDYTLRDPETSKWVEFKGSNLFGDTRELRYLQKNPGSWKVTIDYGEMLHVDPNTVNTGMLGLGSSNPAVANLASGTGSGSDFDMSIHRKKLGVGLTKQITPGMQFDVNFNTEEKRGAKLFGVGTTCSFVLTSGCTAPSVIATGWATLMVPEPISANHTQIEARLSYAFEKVKFNVGYYGSFYQNDNSTLNPGIPGSLTNAMGSLLPLSTGLQTVLARPVALTPDNQLHQIDLNGIYDLTPTTRATMRLAHSQGTQDDSFAAFGLNGAPTGVGSLGGKVVTDLMKLGIVSRPMKKLTLLADLRYENRDDNTPIALYNSSGTGTWTNQTMPLEKTHGKLKASWQFSSDYKGSVGLDIDNIDRGIFTPSSAVFGVSALRQKTYETVWNAELRRRMSEDISGAITVSHSERDGSDWLRPNGLALGVTSVANPNAGFLPTSIFMPSLADRQRDKVKLFADWQPDKKLSMQFSAEGGNDSFTTPTAYGLRSTRMDQFSVDVNYALTYAWNWNGYLSTGTQTLNQARAYGEYIAFKNTSLGAGIGFTGKLMSQLQVGGSLSYADDKDVYAQTLDGSAGNYNIALLAATGGLPDIKFRQTTLKLFGNYAFDKRSAVRVDLIYQETKYNDWAWGYNGVPYTYSDGTTLSQKSSQAAGFIGVTYVYKWL